ncbi:MAG: peptidoglycan DD-metalloendopeptidase family protein [Desulfurivibrionaceae bacterium]|nr:M23 family metallopeptidase [Desulfurivibrionaceae bacterium]
MHEQLHRIIISERGKNPAFFLPGRRARCALAAVFFLLIGGSVTGWFFSGRYLAQRRQIAALESELAASKSLNQRIRDQQAQVNSSLAELKKRSRLIESILSKMGVALKMKKSANGAGGPFRKPAKDSCQDLTLEVNRFLNAVNSVPLGPPTRGIVSSTYGNRLDPINQKPAFHGGLDIKGRVGERISAPADGVVSEHGCNEECGNFIEIEHSSAFRTRYYHLQKRLVSTGDRITRGQTIGLMGNSGRSTGPHLHYEIHYRNRPVDPLRFVQIRNHISRFPTRDRDKS